MPLSFKDRLLIAFVLVWQSVFCWALYTQLNKIDPGIYSEPPIMILTNTGIMATCIISGLSSLVLISLTLYQYRKTRIRFFFLLLSASLIELLLPGLTILDRFFPQFSIGNTGLISYIQVYVLCFVGLASLGLILYAFATYDRQKGNWRGELRKLRKPDIIILSSATCLTVVYLLIPQLYPNLPEAVSVWPIVRFLTLLTPVGLLWVVLWQYRRTGNPFFRYFCIAFSLSVLGLWFGNSSWYFMGSDYVGSMEAAKRAARWNIFTLSIMAGINICVLLIKAYALATYQGEPVPSHDCSPA